MPVNGNQAELRFAPRLPGIYGIEVNVLANSADGNIVDRAAFLTFDVQPTVKETAKNQVIAAALVAGLLAVIAVLVWVRRRKKAL